MFCSRTRYASTWFAYLDSLARFGFSLSHCLWPQNLYLSTMKNQEGHWGYCWCRWVERTNGLMWSFSLSHCLVTTEFVSLYDEESGKRLGVLLMSLGRKNERFNVKVFFNLHIKPFVLSTQWHQQYPQCLSWFFIVVRYKFCGHRQWDREKPNLAEESR